MTCVCLALAVIVAIGAARPVGYAIRLYRLRGVLPDLRAQAQASILTALADG